MENLESLYIKSKKKHLSTIAKILKSYSDAEDVFQEAFVRAITYYPTYNKKYGSLDNWFARILFNQMRWFIKKEKRTKLEDIEKYRYIYTDYNELIDNYIVYSKLIENIKEQPLQSILKMIYLNGYSLKEVASIHNMTINGVKQMCYRFRENMKNGKLW